MHLVPHIHKNMWGHFSSLEACKYQGKQILLFLWRSLWHPVTVQFRSIDDDGDKTRNKNPVLLLFCHFSLIICCYILYIYILYIICLLPHINCGAHSGVVFKALRYKPAGPGSIPNGVTGIFQWHNPSGRTMALGSTQPITGMSTRCISWW